MDLSIKTRAHLSKKAIKALREELVALFGDPAAALVGDGEAVEEARLNTNGTVLYVNREAFFFKPGKNEDETWIPFIDVAKKLAMKTVVIDQPAVPYVASGADVMRPGIVHVDPSVAAGDTTCIVDEKNKTPVAIGRALLDAGAIIAMDKGKAIKTVHHVGDKVWPLKRGG